MQFNPTWFCVIALGSGSVLGFFTGHSAGMGLGTIGPQITGVIGAVAGGLSVAVSASCLNRR